MLRSLPSEASNLRRNSKSPIVGTKLSEDQIILI